MEENILNVNNKFLKYLYFRTQDHIVIKYFFDDPLSKALKEATSLV
jgi:hypothetical protein